MRGGNECNETAAPWCVRGGDVDANHGALLNGNGCDACQLSDQVSKVRLVPHEQQSVVTTSSEKFGNMRRTWAVGKVLIDCGGGL